MEDLKVETGSTPYTSFAKFLFISSCGLPLTQHCTSQFFLLYLKLILLFLDRNMFSLCLFIWVLEITFIVDMIFDTGVWTWTCGLFLCDTTWWEQADWSFDVGQVAVLHADVATFIVWSMLSCAGRKRNKCVGRHERAAHYSLEGVFVPNLCQPLCQRE